MALFLTENDVKQVLTATMALEAVESAHRDLALGLAQDTPRARTRLPQTVLHILQGALPVSYTHLDVYKRQASGWHWRWRFRARCSWPTRNGCSA